MYPNQDFALVGNFGGGPGPFVTHAVSAVSPLSVNSLSTGRGLFVPRLDSKPGAIKQIGCGQFMSQSLLQRTCVRVGGRVDGDRGCKNWYNTRKLLNFPSYPLRRA